MQNTKIFEISRENYQGLCEEMREILKQEKELAARKEKLREAIIEQSGGNRMEYGIKVAEIEVSGSIDYKKLCHEVLGDATVNAICGKYKKSGYTRIDVRSY